MTNLLPDVSISETVVNESPLEWVGMKGIDLPITVSETNCEAHYYRELHAHADVQVNLPAGHVKGIHMSRLYRLLDTLSDGDALSPYRLESLLKAMIETHQDCYTDSARLRLKFDLLTRRPALMTEGASGWKSYPVCLDVYLSDKSFQINAQVIVQYSSTCPCSAALSRQLIEQRFLSDFVNQPALAPDTVAAWLRDNASLATPHSQRSEASVQVDVPTNQQEFGLLSLIDQIEVALGTPLQTAVKRADEQAFAALNGQNLMFVEDAARRIQAALNGKFSSPKVHVRHLESLHPHDAVAWSNAPEQQTTADLTHPSSSILMKMSS
ncbi:GTP cyclohydrolase I FolE2 [Marinomonas rhizomae]|uniref:GTP cyclohydrolase FolE2 n=1 Tax=Marinomonas rhizomae TaxID=491948 RepID=A0A366IZR6_9GAMM|nr:GTP cyclohydrolase FolE2 [Marinomonas rhizomae]RBP79559.1 GTP cyclohydrolase I [Marinomonas rhizomae]RNF71564.1 GTP cyclohydrolase I FolE2 [Marinomonas rhizomae]